MSNFIIKIKQMVPPFAVSFLKRLLKALKRPYQNYKWRNARLILKKEIIDGYHKIGLKADDVILVHSSLSKIGKVDGGPNTVIDTIFEVIGAEGTLVLPTYSYVGSMINSCKKNHIFDLTNPTTCIGAIPSAFLKYKDIAISIHPTHSMSAKGKYAKEITKSHHIGKLTYGSNSPWGKMLEINGKILGIGVSLAYPAYYHYVEDIMEEQFPIKTKCDKVYKLQCKIAENNYIDVEVQPLGPATSKNRIDGNNPFIENYFWEIYKGIGILKIDKIGEATSWYVDANEFCKVLKQLAQLGITIYSTKTELTKKNLYPFALIKNKIIL